MTRLLAGILIGLAAGGGSAAAVDSIPCPPPTKAPVPGKPVPPPAPQDPTRPVGRGVDQDRLDLIREQIRARIGQIGRGVRPQ